MDYFLQQQLYGDADIFWFDNEFLPASPSAFVPYTIRPRIEVGSGSIDNGSSGNANKQMIEFLRKIQSAKMEYRKPDRERGHQHMINERTRREREKENYLALRSMLPIGTKSDKNSIVQMAAKRIQELECYKVQLESRNDKLEAEMGKNNTGGTKIAVRVVNPISGIDYMLEVLKRLKKIEVKIIFIQKC